jgi:hypothetical protein
MAVIVVLLFPIGALAMRAGGNINVHRAIQMVSLLGMIVGLGLGVKLGLLMDYVRFCFLLLSSLLFGTVGRRDSVRGCIRLFEFKSH